MAIFVSATGAKMPPAGQPAVNMGATPGDPSAGTLTKYWYDFLLSLAGKTRSFSAHKNNVNQTISNTSANKITFGTERWDDGGYYDLTNSRWVPPAGLIQINARVVLLSTNAVDQVAHDLTFFKNGAAIGEGDTIGSSGATTLAIGGTLLDQATGTDFYEVFVTIADVSLGARTVFGGTAATYFQGLVL